MKIATIKELNEYLRKEKATKEIQLFYAPKEGNGFIVLKNI